MLEMARGQDEQRSIPAGAMAPDDGENSERLALTELFLAFMEEYGGDGDDQC